MELERIRCRRCGFSGFLVWRRLGHCSLVKIKSTQTQRLGFADDMEGRRE
jgi:hypothetical protein